MKIMFLMKLSEGLAWCKSETRHINECHLSGKILIMETGKKKAITTSVKRNIS